MNNQKHIVSPGAVVMQSQVQELFTSSLTTGSTFCSNPNEITDNSAEPLSPNSSSAGILNTDPRTNAFSMDMASSYTSATALLQKATTMGAKINNNSVAPLRLRGFASGNTNSFKCAHGGYPVVGNGLASITATTNNGSSSFPSSVGHQEQRPGYAAIIQSGMPESPLFVISDDENDENHLAAGEMYRDRCEKMTVDFLGVKLAGHSGIYKKTSYDLHATTWGLKT